MTKQTVDNSYIFKQQSSPYKWENRSPEQQNGQAKFDYQKDPYKDNTKSSANNLGVSTGNSACECKDIQYNYRSKRITGCIQTSTDRVCPEEICCHTVDLNSGSIDSIMREKVPSWKSKRITGQYALFDKQNKYYSNDLGFYLCQNNHGNWQVSRT